MQFTGRAVFSQTPEEVYRAFTSSDVLARVTPGLQELHLVGDQQYEAVLKLAVAGVGGTYRGSMRLQEERPPEHYRLLVDGEGAPGFVKGSATFDFAPSDSGTAVSYLWDLQIGGVIAGVGQRVLGGVAKLLIGQFMAGMERELSRRADPAS